MHSPKIMRIKKITVTPRTAPTVAEATKLLVEELAEVGASDDMMMVVDIVREAMEVVCADVGAEEKVLSVITSSFLLITMVLLG